MNKKNINKSKILIIVGTVREGRVGKTIANWYLKEAKKVAPNLEFELLDLKEENLPLFNDSATPMMHKYNDIQKKLADKIGKADGFIFVTGEYNHSIPGSLKNFLDYIFSEWNYKAAAFVGYGGTGGIRAIEHLIPILAELKVASVASTFNNVSITQVWNAFDEKGNIKPEFIHGNIEQQLKDLNLWINALKVARQTL